MYLGSNFQDSNTTCNLKQLVFKLNFKIEILTLEKIQILAQ